MSKNEFFWLVLYIITVTGYLVNVNRYVKEIEKWKHRYYATQFELMKAEKEIGRLWPQK